MTAEEAINLLDQNVSQLSGTRKDHEALLEAIKVLREATKKEK